MELIICPSDLTNFYKFQHSDIVGDDVTSADMLQLAGQDLTPYCMQSRSAYMSSDLISFLPVVPVPLTLGCGYFVTDESVYLQPANFSESVPNAMHYSGKQQSVQTSNLHNEDWYTATFL